ncbi:DUF11 domain-containing protein [Ramlibacter sp. G-1-2-2]|uniref:DUF11 domain-containing protein n=1 Tax=Ramlibacter agri TaxID=2728837 RepID=A0A848HEG9_9BURK|nr:DUF11 domain-containing protein [Ramlibacter agri]NML46933.1 DUF11 domain-containing protein [Ramlibacter agri]
MKVTLRPFLLFAATLMAALPGFAQSPAVTSNLTAQRVEIANGKAVLSPAEKAKPGDMVEYSGTYRNAGTGSVDKLVATIPVPAGTTFVAGSAEPAKAQASTDGTRFAPMPLMRTVRLPDGTSRQEPVPLADYRYVRWEVGTLAAHADTVVKLRVQIDAAGGAVAASKP